MVTRAGAVIPAEQDIANIDDQILWTIPTKDDGLRWFRSCQWVVRTCRRDISVYLNSAHLHLFERRHHFWSRFHRVEVKHGGLMRLFPSVTCCKPFNVRASTRRV